MKDSEQPLQINNEAIVLLENKLHSIESDLIVLKNAMQVPRKKLVLIAREIAETGEFSRSLIASALGVSKSNLYQRRGSRGTRRDFGTCSDQELVAIISQIIGGRVSYYGYRRITAIVNQRLRSDSKSVVNHKRIYRILREYKLHEKNRS